MDSFIFRHNEHPRIIADATSAATAWTPLTVTFANRPTRYLKPYRRNGLVLSFWAYGLSGDATIDYQVAAWPAEGIQGEQLLMGATESGASPHGFLIADGALSFNSGAVVAKHPVTGATANWAPAWNITETLGYGVCEPDWTSSAESSTNAPAILRISDLMFFESFAVQFNDSEVTGGVEIMAVAYVL